MRPHELLRKLRSPSLEAKTESYYKAYYFRHKLRPSTPELPRSGRYAVVLLDDTVDAPFILTREMATLIAPHLQGKSTHYSRAKAIFDWFQSTIMYGKPLRLRGYSNSAEVMQERKGVCGEMAYLYVALARYAGLISYYVSVRRDHTGKSVHHACASVDTERGTLLVDPAYRTFHVRHTEYRILKDKEALSHFTQFRNRKQSFLQNALPFPFALE